MKKISPEQLQNQLQAQKIKILDVRAEEKFATNHLSHEHATVLNIPKTEIFTMESTDSSLELPFSKNEEVVLTCTTGNSATKCAHILANKGYQVKILDGGMTAWNASKNNE